MKISQRQFQLLFFTAFFALNFLTLPSRLSAECASDGIICLIITSIIAYGAVCVTINFMAKYPGHTFYSALHNSLGKPLAITFYALYIIHLLIFFTYCTRLICDQISVYMLREYPIWFIECIFLSCVIFLCFKRTKTFGNIAQILFYFIFISLILIILLIIQNAHFENMLPMFTSSFLEYFKGTVVTSSFLYSAVIAMPFIIPHVDNFDKKKSLKFFAVAIACVLTIYIIYYVLCISILGTDLCSRLVFAAISIMESNRNRNFIFERYEILLLITIIFLSFIYASVVIKCIKLAIDKTAEKRKIYYISGFILIIFLIALFNYRDIGTVMLYFLESSNITMPFIMLPYTVYALFKIKKRKAEKK